MEKKSHCRKTIYTLHECFRRQLEETGTGAGLWRSRPEGCMIVAVLLSVHILSRFSSRKKKLFLSCSYFENKPK
jgi:hypothetical protein